MLDPIYSGSERPGVARPMSFHRGGGLSYRAADQPR